MSSSAATLDREIIRNLTDENARLREQLRQLETAMVETMPLPHRWRLSSAERTIFGVLVNRRLASKEAIHTILYADRRGIQPDVMTVPALLSRLRRKIVPFGVTIHTAHGVGYWLDDATRERFKVSPGGSRP